MDDFQGATAPASQKIAGLDPADIPGFVRDQIAEREMLPLIRDLNRDMLSGDAVRRTQAEDALRRLGFL